MRHGKSSPSRVFKPVTAEMPCSWVAGLLVGGAADRPATDRRDRGGEQLLSIMNERLSGILGGRAGRASPQRHHHRRRPLRRRDCRRPLRRRRRRSCRGRRRSSPPRWPPSTTLCHAQVIPPQPSPSLLRRRRPQLLPPSCMGSCPGPRLRHALQYSGDIEPKLILAFGTISLANRYTVFQSIGLHTCKTCLAPGFTLSDLVKPMRAADAPPFHQRHPPTGQFSCCTTACSRFCADPLRARSLPPSIFCGRRRSRHSRLYSTSTAAADVVCTAPPRPTASSTTIPPTRRRHCDRSCSNPLCSCGSLLADGQC